MPAARRLGALSAVLVAALAAACSSGTHTATAGRSAPASSPGHASDSPTSSASIAPTPAPSASPLTRTQAAARYTQIIDPANRAIALLQNDVNEQAPWSEYRADALAAASAERAELASLKAVRWPANVQPWITAVVLTYVPASVACRDAEADAGSWPALTEVEQDTQGCVISQDSTDSDQIARLLGLS